MEVPDNITGKGVSPEVLLRLEESNYFLSSRDVVRLLQYDEAAALPVSGEKKRRYVIFQGEAAPVADLRTLLGLPTLEEDFAAFAQMKEKHLLWVRELEQSVEKDRAFTLSDDPHQCAFGKWYDGFHTDKDRLQTIADQIDAPHQQLHQCGRRASALQKARGGQEEAMRQILQEARELCYHKVLPLLDKLVEAYRDSNRSVLVLLQSEGKRLGVLVDEITGVAPLELVGETGLGAPGPYFKNVGTDRKGKIWTQLDEAALFRWAYQTDVIKKGRLLRLAKHP